MKEFISNPDVACIMTIISFILTLVGGISTYFGIKSYFTQKKTNNAYSLLLDNANREWKGKYTEDEIQKLNNQLGILTEQISREIPFQARKALLESKIVNVEQELKKLYKEHTHLKRELAKIHPVEELDKNIRDYIEDEINLNRPKRRIIFICLMLLLAFVFFSSSTVNWYFNRTLQDVINITNAKLFVEHITTYFMAMMTITGITLISPLKKLNDVVLYYKRISIFVIFLLFALWGALVYFVSFNVLIVTYYGQLISGILSIFVFALAFKITVILIKSIR